MQEDRTLEFKSMVHGGGFASFRVRAGSGLGRFGVRAGAGSVHKWFKVPRFRVSRYHTVRIIRITPLADSLDRSHPTALHGSAPARGVRRMAAALMHRDFRVLWFGACTSSIG